MPTIEAHLRREMHKYAVELRRLRPNVGVNDDRLGSSVVMLGNGSDGFVAGDLGGVGGS